VNHGIVLATDWRTAVGPLATYHRELSDDNDSKHCRDFCRDSPSKSVTILHIEAPLDSRARAHKLFIPSNIAHSVALLESSSPELLTEGL
jgi:hypothetical protein